MMYLNISKKIMSETTKFQVKPCQVLIIKGLMKPNCLKSERSRNSYFVLLADIKLYKKIILSI